MRGRILSCTSSRAKICMHSIHFCGKPFSATNSDTAAFAGPVPLHPLVYINILRPLPLSLSLLLCSVFVLFHFLTLFVEDALDLRFTSTHPIVVQRVGAEVVET